ncbi:MAG: hypothetical protein C0606_11430 [Hyphomicrobiales bacterium]|nr:MAG: hypothetical protein C0606_11430 [Hyphomicrobiales bacterium]
MVDELAGDLIASTEPPLPKPKPTPEELAAAARAKVEAEHAAALLAYAPAATSETGTPQEGMEGTLYLVAKLETDGEPINQGMVWRVYSEPEPQAEKLELVATATGGDAEFRLKPGSYLVHAGYGLAGSTSRISIGPGRVRSETVVLNAGGMMLHAVIDENVPLPLEQVNFDLFVYDDDTLQNRKLVKKDIKAETILRLNAGTYHVVSTYGDLNAEVRADIRVKAGKLTEATVYHKAAGVTLKLVNEPGGEALANTSWSVLTPGGDVVASSIGAFPSFILAEGDYTVVAKHNEQLYNREFSVEAGLDREVEVVVMQQ